MKLTTTKIDNVLELDAVSGVAVYGGGIFTTFFYSVFSFLGIKSALMSIKMDHARESAVKEMTQQATELGADGIMGLRYEMTFLCVMAYGTAYKDNSLTSYPIPSTDNTLMTDEPKAEYNSIDESKDVQSNEDDKKIPETNSELAKWRALYEEGKITKIELDEVESLLRNQNAE